MSQNQTKTALIALSLSVTSFPTSVKKKGKIILYGYFNARTGNLDDFAEDVSWVSNCRLGVSEREHVVRRSNRDHTVNKFGLELIELFREN